MAVQTTYSSEHAAAFEGMIANTEPCVLISRDVETAAIGFGKAVKQGTADMQVEAATASGDLFVGITVRDNSATGDSFTVGDSALIMTKGVIWVVADETVNAGSPVYMKASDGAFTDVSSGNLAIPNARFDTSGTVGQLVKIRLG